MQGNKQKTEPKMKNKRRRREYIKSEKKKGKQIRTDNIFPLSEHGCTPETLLFFAEVVR